MPTLRVNKIVNYNDDGPVEFSKGVSVPSGQEIDGTLIINSVGVVTATSFSGVGAGISIPNSIPNGKAIAYTLIG